MCIDICYAMDKRDACNCGCVVSDNKCVGFIIVLAGGETLFYLFKYRLVNSNQFIEGEGVVWNPSQQNADVCVFVCFTAVDSQSREMLISVFVINFNIDFNWDDVKAIVRSDTIK